MGNFMRSRPIALPAPGFDNFLTPRIDNPQRGLYERPIALQLDASP
jgi:hypothetical protein